MSYGVFYVPFSLKCCLCRSDLLNLSVVLFLGKAGIHVSFFCFLGKINVAYCAVSSGLYT